MLSIDEAIAFERQQAKDKRNEHYTFGIQKSKEVAEYHEQIAEWLEELKAIKDGSIPIIHGKAELELHDKEVCNKIIDDFISKLDYECGYDENFNDDLCVYEITREKLLSIAEQLKERTEK